MRQLASYQQKAMSMEDEEDFCIPNRPRASAITTELLHNKTLLAPIQSLEVLPTQHNHNKAQGGLTLQLFSTPKNAVNTFESPKQHLFIKKKNAQSAAVFKTADHRNELGDNFSTNND